MPARSLLALLLAPVRWIGQGIHALLAAIDRVMVLCATPFGVHIKDPLRRYAVFLGVFAAVYLVGVLAPPLLALPALAFGYLGVLAVGRAWVVNEKQRSAIAKKLRDGNPDDMPDLRGVALVSALQLLLLFPLIFEQVYRQFGLFRVPEGATFGHWLLFTFDSYSKGLLGALELYGVKITGIEPDAPAGRHLVLLKRLTIDLILIQGVVRLFAIRETVRDAVAAVKSDRELAERLGRRAVGPLIHALQSDTNAEVRGRAAETLGLLGDSRAVGPLIEALSGPSELVRERSARALGLLGDRSAVEPLTKLLKDSDRYVKAAAGDALKRLDPKAAAKAGVR